MPWVQGVTKVGRGREWGGEIGRQGRNAITHKLSKQHTNTDLTLNILAQTFLHDTYCTIIYNHSVGFNFTVPFPYTAYTPTNLLKSSKMLSISMRLIVKSRCLST